MEPKYFDCPNCGTIEIPEPAGFWVYSEWDECDKLIDWKCLVSADLSLI